MKPKFLYAPNSFVAGALARGMGWQRVGEREWRDDAGESVRYLHDLGDIRKDVDGVIFCHPAHYMARALADEAYDRGFSFVLIADRLARAANP
jgi:hypothetical protein